MQDISFKTGKDNLSGTLFYPPHLKALNPAVLFVHGWASSQTGYVPRALALARSGAVCLTFNLRGHGNSDGKISQFSRKDHLQDVISAYDYLASLLEVDKKKIGVVGASYGGYLSSILTQKRAVKWLVLRAPSLFKNASFNDATDKLLKQNIEVYRQFNLNPDNNYALQALSKYRHAAALIQCEYDEDIPPQTIINYKLALKNNQNFSYYLLSRADHELSTPKYKQAYINLLAEIFVKWLG